MWTAHNYKISCRLNRQKGKKKNHDVNALYLQKQLTCPDTVSSLEVSPKLAKDFIWLKRDS